MSIPQITASYWQIKEEAWTNRISSVKRERGFVITASFPDRRHVLVCGIGERQNTLSKFVYWLNALGTDALGAVSPSSPSRFMDSLFYEFLRSDASDDHPPHRLRWLY